MSGTDEILAMLAALGSAIRKLPVKEEGPRTCRHCGYNLIADKLIFRDGFIADPRGRVYYGDTWLRLRPVEVQILISLMREGGRTLDYEVLAARTINVRKSTPQLVLRQHVFNIRKALKAAGVPDPVRAENRIGYYWSLNH